MKVYFTLVTYVYLRRRWQQLVEQLVERFFDINMIKTGLSYFLTGDAKMHIAPYACFGNSRVFSDLVIHIR